LVDWNGAVAISELIGVREDVEEDTLPDFDPEPLEPPVDGMRTVGSRDRMALSRNLSA